MNQPASSLDLRAAKARFVALNEARRQWVMADLRPHQRDFVQILPLVFHFNHRRLPGYEPRNAVFGIPDYTPCDETLKAASRLAGRIAYRHRPRLWYDIQALYLITSLGTLDARQAQRFELWICARPGLVAPQQATLQARGTAIVAYAQRLALDFTCRLVELSGHDGRERGLFHAPPSDPLMLDRLYSCGILLAGRLPLWWLTSPEDRVDTAALEQRLGAPGSVAASDLVDFGAPGVLPAETLFRHGLACIHRAFDDPYRELLQLLLAEVDMQAFPTLAWTCELLRKPMFQGDCAIDVPDLVVVQYAKVERYLRDRDEPERLQLARRALYFLAQVRLSTTDSTADWRRRSLAVLIQNWGWQAAELAFLDARRGWKLDRVRDEDWRLKRELRRAYQVLAEFAQRHLADETGVDDALYLLGRQLHARLDMRPGKVEQINSGISKDLSEDELTLVRDVADEGPSNWLLFRGRPTPGLTRPQKPLKRAPSLIELLVWCRMNGLLGALTRLYYETPEPTLDNRELKALTGFLREGFPEDFPNLTDPEALATTPRLGSVWLFVNTGLDPMEKFSRQGKVLISSRSDALSFGAQRENLAKSFELVMVNTWGEVLVSRHRGPEALVECILEWCRWAALSTGSPPPQPQVQSFSCNLAPVISQRVATLFGDLAQHFYHFPHGGIAHYVLELERMYYVLYADKGELEFRRFGDWAELMQALSAPRRAFTAVVIDRYALAETPLPQIYARNRAGAVQVFCLVRGEQAELYVLDERGSLFFQRSDFFGHSAIVVHFDLFLDRLAARPGLFIKDETERSLEIEYYWVEQDRLGNFSVEIQPAIRQARRENLLEVEVTVEVSEHRPNVYHLRCGGKDFSSLEYGVALYREIARHVLDDRHENTRYPLYVTGLEIRGVRSDDLQTLHYLNHKKEVETRLNRALSAL